jgi:hypothetical protein
MVTPSTVAQKEGIKELKEVTEALIEISIRVASIFKDGYQPTDIAALFSVFTKDEVVKAKIFEAYNGINKVKGELKDIDVSECVELVSILLQFIPRIIDLFKKEGNANV